VSSGGGVDGSGGQGAGGSGGLVGSGGGGEGGAISTGGGGAGGCTGIAHCSGKILQCGDGVDNDADGFVDAGDSECLGPCDNSEDSFFTSSIDMMVIGCSVDCYFDQDSGSGNDGCYWNHKCDPHEVAPDYYPESDQGIKCAYDPGAMTPGTAATCAELFADQLPNCHDFCGPLVPNGCDCFGCCEVPGVSGGYVWFGSLADNGTDTCTLADAADPTKCHPCEPVPGCLNTCETCELCIAKSDVPPACAEAAQCEPGRTPCGLPSQGCCPSGSYCVTGCCQPVPT
jgi:hypothetical protein